MPYRMYAYLFSRTKAGILQRFMTPPDTAFRRNARGRRSSWSARGAAPLKRPTTGCTPTDHCRSFARRAPAHLRAGPSGSIIIRAARMEHQSAAKPHEDNAIGSGGTAESHENTAENLHRRKCASVACLQLPMRSHDREIEISTRHDGVGSFAVHLPGA